MYWMTTGKKPLESAARVKNDTMLPASSLAEVSVYGAALLDAIEWAMHPDESRRPQTVELFRAAIQGSRKLRCRRSRSPGCSPTGPPSARRTRPLPCRARRSRNHRARQRRNLLCTIMFLDLVGYSVRSVDDQVSLEEAVQRADRQGAQGRARGDPDRHRHRRRRGHLLHGRPGRGAALGHAAARPAGPALRHLAVGAHRPAHGPGAGHFGHQRPRERRGRRHQCGPAQ